MSDLSNFLTHKGKKQEKTKQLAATRVVIILTTRWTGNKRWPKAYIPLRRKKVAFGPGVGLAPQRHYFALGIPTWWYLKILKFAFPPTQNIKFAFPPDTKPQRQPVEYRLRWVPGVGSLRWACTFHIFCVDFICVG